jgi:uncharacterized membrane protein
MTLFWRRVAIIVTMCAVTSYSIPILFAAGNKTVEWTFNGQNVTGIICSLNAQDNPEFRSIYYPGTLVVIVANIIATVVAYFLVGYVIYKRFYNKKLNKYAVNTGKTNLQTTKISIVDDLVQEMKSGIKSDKHCSEINELNITLKFILLFVFLLPFIELGFDFDIEKVELELFKSVSPISTTPLV